MARATSPDTRYQASHGQLGFEAHEALPRALYSLNDPYPSSSSQSHAKTTHADRTRLSSRGTFVLGILVGWIAAAIIVGGVLGGVLGAKVAHCSRREDAAAGTRTTFTATTSTLISSTTTSTVSVSTTTTSTSSTTTTATATSTLTSTEILLSDPSSIVTIATEPVSTRTVTRTVFVIETSTLITSETPSALNAPPSSIALVKKHLAASPLPGNACDQNDELYHDSGYTLALYCGTDYGSRHAAAEGGVIGDILNIFVPTFVDCVTACTDMNTFGAQWGLQTPCRAVSWSAEGQGTTTIPTANCWLKNGTLANSQDATTSPHMISAKLRSLHEV